MIPNQEMIPYPVFGDNSTKEKPDDPKYAAGFQPGDVLPAEWLNWFLNRSSGGQTVLNSGVAAVEAEINNLLAAAGDSPDASLSTQLATAVATLINNAILVEQQKTAVGVPTLWFGPKPDWALDFGNGAATKYLWSNYPKLNNDKFKGILSTLSTAGHMTAYDAAGFYVPDLRGLVPIGYGTNAKRTGETTAGGTLGQYLASANKSHNHTFTGSAVNSGNMSANASHSHTKDSSNSTASDGTNTVTTGKNSRKWTSDTTNINHHHSVTAAGSISSVGAAMAKPPTFGCMFIVRYE